MKLSKCPGPDEINPRILKITIDSISTALNLIFNRSLLYGEIPGGWKRANVVTLFKRGSKRDSNNYRPVNLTSTVGTFLEGIIRD